MRGFCHAGSCALTIASAGTPALEISQDEARSFDSRLVENGGIISKYPRGA
jgi:hypothetical protein